MMNFREAFGHQQVKKMQKPDARRVSQSTLVCACNENLISFEIEKEWEAEFE